MIVPGFDRVGASIMRRISFPVKIRQDKDSPWSAAIPGVFRDGSIHINFDDWSANDRAPIVGIRQQDGAAAVVNETQFAIPDLAKTPGAGAEIVSIEFRTFYVRSWKTYTITNRLEDGISLTQFQLHEAE